MRLAPLLLLLTLHQRVTHGAEIDVPGFKLVGINTALFDCSQAAPGPSSVTVTVGEVGLEAQGTVQRTGCRGSLPAFSVSGSVSSSEVLDMWGVTVKGVTVSMTSQVNETTQALDWSGTLGLQEAGFGGVSGSGQVSFSEAGVRSFTLSASLSLGPVRTPSPLTLTVTEAGAAVSGSGAVVVSGPSFTVSASGSVGVVRDSSTGTDEWTLEATQAEGAETEIYKVTVRDVAVSLVGSGGVWSGEVSGTASIDTAAEVSMAVEVADNAFGSLAGGIAVTSSGVRFTGELSVPAGAAGCSEAGTAAVTASLEGVASFGARVTYDPCAQAAGDERFTLKATVAQATVAGAVLSDVDVDVQGVVGSTGKTTVWSGRVGGTASLLAGAVTGTAAAQFAGGKVQTLQVTGAVSLGPVSGTLDLLVDQEKGQWTGKNTMDVSTNNVQVAGLEADVTYVPGGSGALTVEGAVSELTVFGAVLRDVTVSVSGSKDEHGVMQWTGTVGGRAELGDSVTVDLTAALEENAFASLTGDLAITVPGVSFQGTVEVDANRAERSCTVMQADGSLEVEGIAAGFTAGVTVDTCATGDSPKYVVTASHESSVSVQGLQLTSAYVLLSGKDAKSWDGRVEANAELFGGNSKAVVDFSGGKLQKIFVTTTVTVVGMMNGELQLEYVPGCSEASQGTADMTVTLPDTEPLQFTGTASFVPQQSEAGGKCTWDFAVEADVVGLDGFWTGPAGTSITDIHLSLRTESGGDNVQGSKLSKRVWIGKLEGKVEGDLGTATGTVELNSKDASVTVGLTYEDPDGHLTVSASFGTDCKGVGSVVVRDLGNGLQGVEAVAQFEKDCTGNTEEWRATGTVSGFRIPVAGGKKMIEFPTATVEVHQNAAGTVKTVKIGGTFLEKFYLNAEFTLPYKAENLKVVGGALLLADRPVTPAALIEGWGAGGLDGALRTFAEPIYDALNEIELSEVALEVSLAKKAVTLTGSGTAFDVPFYVAAGISSSSTSSGWNFGIGMTFDQEASGGDKKPEFDGVVGKVMELLLPRSLSFTLAKGALSFGSFTVRKSGFSVSSLVPMDSGLLGELTSAARKSGALSSMMDAASSGGGLLVSASFASASDLSLSVQLSGGIDIVPEFRIESVAVLLRLSALGSSEVGFAIVMEMRFGTPERVIRPAGAMTVKLPSGTWNLELSLDMTPDWENPFGLQGVTILFPWAVSASMAPTMLGLPNKLAFIAGVAVAGTEGRVVFSADLENWSKTAFKVDVGRVHLLDIVKGLTQCGAPCETEVAEILGSVSMDSFNASFNPSPSPVSIQIADAVSEPIPSGVHLAVNNLNLWNVLSGSGNLSVSLDKKGLSGTVALDPVNWGGLRLTRSKTNKAEGPYFQVELSAKKRLLLVQAAAEVLSQSVAVDLLLTDTKAKAAFDLELGGLRSEVNLTTDLKSFDVQLAGRVSTGLGGLGDALVAPISALSDLASEGLQEAQEALVSAEASIASARKALNSARVEGKQNYDDAKKALGDQSKLKAECDRKQKRCNDAPFWKKYRCAAAVACWLEYGGRAAAKAAIELAETVVNGALEAWNAAVSAAQGVLRLAEEGLSLARSGLSYAQAVTDALGDLADLVGDFLNVVKVHGITWGASASPSNVAVNLGIDISLLKKRLTVSVTAELDFDRILSYLSGLVQDALTGFFGEDNPALPNIVPQYGSKGCVAKGTGKTEALEGQRAECPTAMNGFQLSGGGCSGESLQMFTRCKQEGVQAAGVPLVCETRYTGCKAVKGGPLSSLSGSLAISCPAGEALRVWELIADGCAAGEHRFEYTCCSGVDEARYGATNTEEAACFDASSVENLAVSEVRCPNEGLLAGWKVVAGECWGGLHRIEYQCLARWKVETSDCFYAQTSDVLTKEAYQCVGEGVMNGFDVARYGCTSEEDARNRVRCQKASTYPTKSCKVVESDCFDPNGGTAQFWERAEPGLENQLWIKCPAGQAMKRFYGLLDTGRSDCKKFQVECCEADFEPGYSPAAAQRYTDEADDSNPGAMLSNGGTSFYGHFVHCADDEVLNSFTLEEGGQRIIYRCLRKEVTPPTPAPTPAPPTLPPAPPSWEETSSRCESNRGDTLLFNEYLRCPSESSAINGFDIGQRSCSSDEDRSYGMRCHTSSSYRLSGCSRVESKCVDEGGSLTQFYDWTWPPMFLGCGEGKVMTKGFYLDRSTGSQSCRRFVFECCSPDLSQGAQTTTVVQRTPENDNQIGAGGANLGPHPVYCGDSQALVGFSFYPEYIEYTCLQLNQPAPTPKPVPATPVPDAPTDAPYTLPPAPKTPAPTPEPPVPTPEPPVPTPVPTPEPPAPTPLTPAPINKNIADAQNNIQKLQKKLQQCRKKKCTVGSGPFKIPVPCSCLQSLPPQISQAQVALGALIASCRAQKAGCLASGRCPYSYAC